MIGFSLTEVVVVVAILAVVSTAAAPVYRGYVDHQRRNALIEEMVALAMHQERLRRASGSYGSGTFQAMRAVDSLPPSLAWRPRLGERWQVVAFDAHWVVRAGDGRVAVCRRFPENVPCVE